MSNYQMVGDSFRLGYRFQRHWDHAMAAAFFCGELGGGLFLVSLIIGDPAGMILGLLIAAFVKPVFHLAHMGVPGKSWRAILRPDRSWISRGLMAMVIFSAAGTGCVINLIWLDVMPFGRSLEVLAGAAAVVVMTYHGLSMAHSTAIALWNTAMMPVLSFLYALTGGVAIILVLPSADILSGNTLHLPSLLQGLLVADLVMVWAFVYAAYSGSAGARLSAELLISKRYAYWFVGGVVALGLVLPLLVLSLWQGHEALHLIAAAAMLTGFYLFRILIFKAGVYEPVLPI